jgi:hypothetical protein
MYNWEEKRTEMQTELREAIKKHNHYFSHHIIKEEIEKIFEERKDIL